jgi:transposase-like protein
MPNNETTYEVVCPHCSKSFEAQPLTGGAERHKGFKCPHCRLFVAYHRAEEPDESNGSET